jgi:hypothetical protein
METGCSAPKVVMPGLVAVGDDQELRLLEQRQHLHPFRWRPRVERVLEHDEDVQGAAFEVVQQLERLPLDEVERDARVAGGEPGQGERQQPVSGGGEEPDPQPSGVDPGLRAQVLLGGLDDVDDLLRPVREAQPGLGEPQALRVTFDEADAGLVLKAGELVGDGGGREFQHPRRRGDAAGAEDLKEDAEPVTAEHAPTLRARDQR